MFFFSYLLIMLYSTLFPIGSCCSINLYLQIPLAVGQAEVLISILSSFGSYTTHWSDFISGTSLVLWFPVSPFCCQFHPSIKMFFDFFPPCFLKYLVFFFLYYHLLTCIKWNASNKLSINGIYSSILGIIFVSQMI